MSSVTMDGRRRQYVPLSVTFAQGRMGTRLKESFGRDGLLVWVCFLAACKRGSTQGTFRYTSEAGGWDQLGLLGLEPAFTLADFFRLTGRLKKTSRRQSGEVVDVQITAWEEWNKEFKRASDAAHKSSKRAGLPEVDTATLRADAPTLRGTEVELELEGEVSTLKHVDQDVKNVYEHWRSCRGKSHPRYAQISPARRKKIITRLGEFSVFDLKCALDNVARDDWAERRKHDDITTLFKSREAVERWLEMTPTAKEPGVDLTAYDRYTA